MLDGGTLIGTLSKGFDRREVAATLGLGAFFTVLGSPAVGLGPGASYALQVEGATVEAVPIGDGERRS